MSLEPGVMEKWTQMMELWPKLFSGSMAETVSMDPEHGFSVEFMVAMRETENFPALLESLFNLMKPMMSMYEDMGMPMNFDLKLNARSHGDLQIHQYNFMYDLEKMEPQAAEQIRAMGMEKMMSELTVLDNRLLWTMGSSSLDDLIARIRKGELGKNSLHARSVYPAGGFYYYDMDMGEYFVLIAGMMPPEAELVMFDTLAENLKESPPLSGAGFRQENRIQFNNLIPAGFIRAFVRMSAPAAPDQAD
jgi:hypothetical protein